jgi:hypothetical protein
MLTVCWLLEDYSARSSVPAVRTRPSIWSSVLTKRCENRASKRLPSPHRLSSGRRKGVSHYVLLAPRSPRPVAATHPHAWAPFRQRASCHRRRRRERKDPPTEPPHRQGRAPDHTLPTAYASFSPAILDGNEKTSAKRRPPESHWPAKVASRAPQDLLVGKKRGR